MVEKKGLISIIVFLIAVIVIVSGIAMVYFVQYEQASIANKNYVDQLNAANTKYSSAVAQYNSLVSRFNAQSAGYNQSVNSLEELALSYNESVIYFNGVTYDFSKLSDQYNQTFHYLTETLAVENTSQQSYVDSVKSLSSLWQGYLAIEDSYQSIESNFTQVSSKLKAELASLNQNPSTGIVLATPTEPLSTSLLTINVLIDFGNGSRHWYNETAIQAGWNMYTVTLVLTNGNVNATWYPDYGEHFISGIDNVIGNSTQSWFVWNYNETAMQWQYSQVGADQMTAFNGSTYAWSLCSYTSSGAPNCTP